MAGIIAYGAYIPRMRLQRAAIYAANSWFAPGLKGLARGERSIANWDEDSVTMAVEAARDCLAGRDRGDVSAVMLASTSFPFADRQNAGIVKEALNLDDGVASLDLGASQRAGTGALIQAARAATSGHNLVIASDNRRSRPGSEDELLNGDAAAAFLMGEEDGVARLVAHCSRTVDFNDRFRAEGEDFDADWEARWVREEGYGKIAVDVLNELIAQSGIDPASVSALLVGIPAPRVATTLAKQVGIPAEAVREDLPGIMGSAGCAQPLIQLAHALETASPGDRIAVIGFGHGADALLFEVTDAIGKPQGLGVSGWLARGRAEENYMKFLAFSGALKMHLGKRAEFDQKPVLTALYRERKTVLGLVGGRCTQTGAIQYPKTEISVAANNPARGTQEDYPLADVPARILTYTADTLTYTPDPPNYYGMVEFEGGGRMYAEFTDVDPKAVEVGAPMRMMFRIKARDDRSGFVKYFWKAVPAAGSRHDG